MINTSELRVGNEVFYLDKTWCTVVEVGLYWDKVGIAGVNGMVKIADIEPIPLTPKVLKMVGFVKENGFGVLRFPPRMGIRFYGFNYAECDIIQDKQYVAFKFSHLKYLHQLQNLYHSLSGNELEINFLSSKKSA